MAFFQRTALQSAIYYNYKHKIKLNSRTLSLKSPSSSNLLYTLYSQPSLGPLIRVPILLYVVRRKRLSLAYCLLLVLKEF